MSGLHQGNRRINSGVNMSCMNVQRHFPATTWVWKKLTSRMGRRIFLILGSALLLLLAVLRIEAAIFEFKVISTIRAMERLRPDETTRAEMQKLIPGMRPAAEPGMFPQCRLSDCYLLRTEKVPYSWATHLLDIPFVLHSAYVLGARFGTFHALVRIKSERVYELGYGLTIEDTFRNYGAVGDPRAVFLSAEIVRGFSGGASANDDESPNFRWYSWREDPAPDWVLQFSLTPDASAKVHRDVFAIQMGCIWSWSVCRSTRQLVPDAWQDIEAIRASTSARLASTDPCPNRLLSRRVRDFRDVLLYQVGNISPSIRNDGLRDRNDVEFTLLSALRGEEEITPAHRVGEASGKTTFSVPISNPDRTSLQKGERVLMFSDDPGGVEVDKPCSIIPATESAMATVRSALAASKFKVPDGDRAPRDWSSPD